MLLQNILNGSETSPLVLIHDNVELSGRGLTCSFVQSLLQRVDFVVAILYDIPPEKFLSFVDEELHTKIHCFDGFSDPLHWDTHSGNRAFIHKDSNITELVKSSFTDLNLADRAPGELIKVAVVIDSLSKMLLWNSTPSTCRSVHQLCSANATGYQVDQVVCLVHTDLHEQHALDCINSLASTVLSVSLCLDTSTFSSDQCLCCCKILHKRKTGKVLRKMQYYRITKQGAHVFISPEHDWLKDSTGKHNKNEEEVDPTCNLSFNLKLNEDERVARSKLSLPYMFHEKSKDKGNGKIFYQPDEVDDFDEEDPDNDLDI